jgi:hypothetical protein
MLTTEQMLRIDPELSSLTEDELEELRDALYETAQLGFDIYWSRKHGSKNPTGLLTSEAKEDTL